MPGHYVTEMCLRSGSSSSGSWDLHALTCTGHCSGHGAMGLQPCSSTWYVPAKHELNTQSAWQSCLCAKVLLLMLWRAALDGGMGSHSGGQIYADGFCSTCDKHIRKRACLTRPTAGGIRVDTCVSSHQSQFPCAGFAGVKHLYVHVVADNRPALQLYCQSCRFEVEAEESPGQAQLLSRPKRLLLHRQL